LVFSGFLLFYLNQNHCFSDGNKRTAWLAGLQVLLSLGLTVLATTGEAEELCLSIAGGSIDSADDVVDWLAERLDTVH
jgi:death-on-curing protein